MFSSPMKTRRAPPLVAFSMKIRDLVAKRVDLDGEADVHGLVDLHLDHAVEQLFAHAVTGEVVVGDEEALDAEGVVLAHGMLQIVGRAHPALAPLHVDDRAERALVRAAPAEVEARHRADGPAHDLARNNRGGCALQRGQILHEVVDRCEPAVPGVAQHLVEPAVLGLAGKERDPEFLRGADLRR